jgi:GDP-4-dehydro-6-deoxy-D-mannose reductase
MQFLITGINGFVGPHLARHLISQGHDVIGMTHKSVAGTDEPSDRFNLISGDLTDRRELDDVFTSWRFDGVFHLASKTHPPTSFQEPVKYFEVNALGTIYIAEAITKHQPDAVLMNCSSSMVYGTHPDGTHISETTPTLTSNPYAVSKLAAELYIHERCQNGRLKAFTVRPFSHTGPGRPANYSISSDAIQIARIIKGKQEPVIRVGNLTSKRIVMDVRDVVEIYSRLMSVYLNPEMDMQYGEVFNIGGNDLMSMGYYLLLMLGIYGLDVNTKTDDKLYRKADIPVQYPDSTKVRELLGWNPTYDIRTTLRDLVEYWLERV